MGTTEQGQTSIDEKVVDDPQLLKALEERLKAQHGKKEATDTFNTKDAVYKNRERALKFCKPYVSEKTYTVLQSVKGKSMVSWT